MKYYKKTDRSKFRKVLMYLIKYTKATGIWIPKTVQREFLSIKGIQREKFLNFLSVEINKLGLDFRICPV